ncbi:EAL domain-containing protein [uncultured Thiodictyon sp.]|uniref:EAL domain-containing protein n=1 Tax=uncultured Thiodictyon sp. TaxID=1846217 RepID=UPI0025D1E5C5|nr:EAL domain-containing protein [uncultured Thiodictyon sp.]
MTSQGWPRVRSQTLFSVEMKLHGEQRMAIETGIRLALQEDQFSLLFQPEVELASGPIVSAEALIRWTSGPLGEVSPARFIPVADSWTAATPPPASCMPYAPWGCGSTWTTSAPVTRH